MDNKQISYEYIRGLVEDEGCFTFSSINFKNDIKKKLPAFSIAMSRRDKHLFDLIKNRLKLRNLIYEYPPRKRPDGYKRDGMVILIIRDIGQLKNIVVPLFYKKLYGNKSLQFEKWIETIESDPDVPDGYKFISQLYKSGYYEKIHDFD